MKAKWRETRSNAPDDASINWRNVRNKTHIKEVHYEVIEIKNGKGKYKQRKCGIKIRNWILLRETMCNRELPIDTSDPQVLKEVMENLIWGELKIDVNLRSARKLGNKTCFIELNNINEKERHAE